MKNVLVTGGTGLLGNNIIRQLMDSGFDVAAAVRKSSDRQPFSDLDVEIREVDFEDQASIEQSLEGIDTVIHSAGFIWFGWKKLEQSRKVNVGITSRIAGVCLSRNMRFIHVSSLDALPVGRGSEDIVDEEALNNESKWQPKVPCNYVISKREADQAIKKLWQEGLSGCIVHPGLMLGPYDWKPSSGELIQAVAKLGFWFSCPTGGISVTDVRDVANATIRAAQDHSTSGRHFILGGHNIPYWQLCKRIAEKCGVRQPRGRTGWIAYGAAGMIGSLSALFGKETIVNTAAIRMAWLFNYYSSQRAIDELGYQIRDLDETLDEAIEWLASQQMIKISK